jgi:transposase-like protein
MESPTTLLEAIVYFADADRAHDFVVRLRWPNGVACPTHGCGSADVLFMATRRTWKCRECKRQFSVKVGTIFEDSPISLSKWLPAMWMLGAHRNGISSCELARSLKVTQKTAWFMLHRIRHAMKVRSLTLLSGYVEADETYVGGKAKNRHSAPSAGRPRSISKGPTYGKVTVMGMIERYGGNVRAMTITQTTGAYMQKRLNENVKRGATLYTDAARHYSYAHHEYNHYVIDHAVRYVEGHIHTNSIENFWSCLKRTLHGTYIAPRPQHLDRYVTEQVWRFNNRKDPDSLRFGKALKAVDGRRLTYKQLTGKF